MREMLNLLSDANKLAYVKTDDEDSLYQFFINRHREEIEKEIKAIANKPIQMKKACEMFGMDLVSFLVFLGHLRKTGLIRDVKIR